MFFMNLNVGVIFGFLLGFFYICVRCNIKIYCFEINVDIRLYMIFEILVLISCIDD